MELQYALREGTLHVHLLGELGHHEAIDGMARLSGLVETLLPGKVVLELSGLDFMDSSGIAVILQTARRCRLCGSGFAVRGTPPQAKKVLLAAGVQRLVDLE